MLVRCVISKIEGNLNYTLFAMWPCFMVYSFQELLRATIVDKVFVIFFHCETIRHCLLLPKTSDQTY